MLYVDVLTKLVDQFNGPILRLDPYTVPLSSGLYAQNITYVRGEAATRNGHQAVVAQADGAIPSMANWFFVFGSSQVSVIAYYTPSIGLRTLNQLGFTVVTVMPVTGAAGASTATNGQRLYAAFYDATGRFSTTGGQVYGWNIGADPLFAAPLANTPTVTEPSAGLCTAGVCRIGFLPTTRNGYTTQLSPVNGNTVFTPVTFTCAGSKNLQVSIPGPLAAYMSGGTYQLVMTTKANLNRYFAVPGTITLAGAPTVITASISDDDLVATGTDVTSYVTLLTSSVGGVPPFNPSAVFTYSSRMGYITIDAAGFPVVYMSDQNNYQKITADQHAIYLQGQATPVGAFSLRGVCYIGTPHAFYSVEDNGGVPATWTPAQLLDGSIGILSPTCIVVNPAQGYAAIASDRGFYIFQGGIFPALPISYYQQSDWQRINWMVPTTVQIADDQLNKRFIVTVPLTNRVASVAGTGPFTITTGINPHLYPSGLAVKIAGVSGAPTITVTGPGTFTIPGGSGTPTTGATIFPQTASHRMTWDYTEGDTPETVKYSLDSFAAYNMGSVAIIQNINNFLNEVWYGCNTAGAFIRQMDGTEALPFRDPTNAGAAAAINSLYQTALIPGPEGTAVYGQAPESTVHDFHGAHFRVAGNGQLSLLALGVDGVLQVAPAASPITLSPRPGIEVLVKWAFRNEQQSIQFGTNGIDQNMNMNLIRAYYTNAMPQR